MNLNLNTCAFMVFLGLILGFIFSKEGKILDHKKFHAIVNMPVLTNPQKIQVLMVWLNFINVSSRTLLYRGANH